MGLALSLTILPFAAFAAYSLAHALPITPVSGAIKSAKWLHSLAYNLSAIPHQFFFFITKDFGTGFLEGPGSRAQMIVPVLVGFIILVVWKVKRMVRSKLPAIPLGDKWPAAIALTMIIKIIYYITFVEFSHQGFWYYLCPALVCAYLLAYYFFPRELSKRATVLISLLFIFSYTLSAKEMVNFNKDFRWLPHYLMQEETSALISSRVRANSTSGKYVDISDGVFSYFLDLPSVSGVGLAIDAQAYRNAINGPLVNWQIWQRLHDTFVKRGYTLGLHSRSADSGRFTDEVTRRTAKIKDDWLATLYFLKPLSTR